MIAYYIIITITKDLRPRTGPVTWFADAVLFGGAVRTAVRVVVVHVSAVARNGRGGAGRDGCGRPITAAAAVLASPARRGHGHLDGGRRLRGDTTVASGGRAERFRMMHFHDTRREENANRKCRRRLGRDLISLLLFI